MQGNIAHNFSCQSGSDSLVSSGNNARSSNLKSEWGTIQTLTKMIDNGLRS